MRLRWKMFFLGILIGSLGPLFSLFIEQTYYFLDLLGIDPVSFFLMVYPFSLVGMAFDGTPSHVQVIIIIILAILNLSFFGGIGLLLGFILERKKSGRGISVGEGKKRQ